MFWHFVANEPAGHLYGGAIRLRRSAAFPQPWVEPSVFIKVTIQSNLFTSNTLSLFILWLYGSPRRPWKTFNSSLSQGQKTENLLPRPPKNNKNRARNPWKSNFWDAFLRYLNDEKLVLRAPGVPISSKKSVPKLLWKEHPQNGILLMGTKNFQNVGAKPYQNH